LALGLQQPEGMSMVADEAQTPWLCVRRGSLPLVVCMPHTGSLIPAPIEAALLSPWLARKDTDWHIERLYAFVSELGASLVRTDISRTVIDPNRDPSGASLYPGQNTTELCPTTTFDGEPLYRAGAAPAAEEIAARRRSYFEPYHHAIATELARLRARHEAVVLYDCHAIRSQSPRLFAGTLPHLNIGTFSGASCAPQLTQQIEALCAASEFTWVTNGRFKGGYTTRHYGRPAHGVHAVQMELSFRGFLHEPDGALTEANWPSPWEAHFAAPLRALLERILATCLSFASQAPRS
jgi:N-formylglutamate deformylase